MIAIMSNTLVTWLTELVQCEQQLAAVTGRPAWLAVDTETDSLGAMSSHLCGISLSAKEGTGDLRPRDELSALGR